jgi:galactose-1-phosphate uridylyltransferase
MEIIQKEYDENCYLCPGNPRTSGIMNPKYPDTFVFQNDFPAVNMNQPEFNSKKGILHFQFNEFPINSRISP